MNQLQCKQGIIPGATLRLPTPVWGKKKRLTQPKKSGAFT